VFILIISRNSGLIRPNLVLLLLSCRYPSQWNFHLYRFKQTPCQLFSWRYRPFASIKTIRSSVFGFRCTEMVRLISVMPYFGASLLRKDSGWSL